MVIGPFELYILRKRPQRGSESAAKLSTNVNSWLARPRNEHRLVREVGVGKLVSAEIFDLSGNAPVLAKP